MEKRIRIGTLTDVGKVEPRINAQVEEAFLKHKRGGQQRVTAGEQISLTDVDNALTASQGSTDELAEMIVKRSASDTVLFTTEGDHVAANLIQKMREKTRRGIPRIAKMVASGKVEHNGIKTLVAVKKKEK